MEALAPLSDSAAASSLIPSTPTTVTPNSHKTLNVHLVLLLHGLYGSPANLWCLEEEIANLNKSAQEAAAAAEEEASPGGSTPPDIVVLNASSYGGAHTWDGIDVNAQRVEQELDAEIARLESEGRTVSVISITGYSLGGLIARALVGHLHARTPSFFEKHRPASFATIATPHLGVLKYPSWQSQWVHALGQRLFSRTGQQLYCLDTERGGPLLATMANPDRIYLRALSLFRSITIFANGVNDLTVPYCTAAICDHDPFIEHEVVVDGRPHVHVQLDGYIVCSWNSDPDAIEVEEMVVQIDDSESSASAAETPPVPNAAVPVPTPAPVGCKPPRAPRPTPATTTGIMPSQRPWLPPVFYLNKPGILRYALFPLLPLLLPVVLSIVAITFAYHSFQSSQRLKVHQANKDKRPLLLGIDDGDGEPKGYGATGTTNRNPTSSTGTARSDDGADGAVSPSSPASAQPSRTGTPQLVPPATQPVLTPLQHSMIAHLSSLPLERVVAWFPSAFNSHAVIIARNARNPRWAWQGAGRQIVRDWAARVCGAGREVLAELSL